MVTGRYATQIHLLTTYKLKTAPQIARVMCNVVHTKFGLLFPHEEKKWKRCQYTTDTGLVYNCSGRRKTKLIIGLLSAPVFWKPQMCLWAVNEALAIIESSTEQYSLTSGKQMWRNSADEKLPQLTKMYYMYLNKIRLASYWLSIEFNVPPHTIYCRSFWRRRTYT